MPMAAKLFVGGLPYAVTDDRLRELFEEAGNVVSAKVIVDRETNRSKGFGFVEMSTDEEAKVAIDKLNGKEVDGRALTVNEARPQAPRSFSGSGGGNFRGNKNDRSY
jgi:RNA recognition motif-containing protein